MMGRFKALGFLALMLQFTLGGTILTGQDKKPESSCGDPQSPGGRPLAEVASKEEEFLRTYNQLKKEQAELVAKAKQLDKEARESAEARRTLLAAIEASDKRLVAADAAVELGRQLGGVSERAASELKGALEERRTLREAAGRWERRDNAINGARREWADNVSKLKQRAEAFAGLVAGAKRTAPDSFAEIEKRAKELNQELGK